MKYFYLILSILLFISCQPEDKSDFNQAALAQTVYNTEMQKSSIQDVIAAHKGNKIILDIWASWCKDCIKSLPDVANFQEEHPDIQWVFLSVDDSEDDWRNGMAKYMDKFNISGEQYFFNTGWSKEGNNAFTDYIDLDWIPRYMLLDENGDIMVYYAKKITDNKIKAQLKKN